MSFLEAANSRFVYYVVLAVLLVVVMILLNFLRLALKQAKALNISNQQIATAVKTTLTVSIGPALSVLVPFLALMAVLGVPWSWLRLSVIGSAPMEMILADMSLTGAGFQNLGAEKSMEGFCICALTIAFTCSPQMLFNLLFTKSYTTIIEKARRSRYADVTNVIVGALYVGVMCNLSMGVFVNNLPARNFVPVASFLTALAIAVTGDVVMEKYKLRKLREYSFAIYIVLGMLSAILWTKIL